MAARRGGMPGAAGSAAATTDPDTLRRRSHRLLRHLGLRTRPKLNTSIHNDLKQCPRCHSGANPGRSLTCDGTAQQYTVAAAARSTQ